MAAIFGQATGNEKTHLSSFDQTNTSNTMSKLYVRKISSASIQFSEQNGMGGIWEAIGQCDFTPSATGGSEVKMYTTTGGFLDKFVNILFLLFIIITIYTYWKTGNIYLTFLAGCVTVMAGASIFQRRYAVTSLFGKLCEKIQVSKL